MNASTTAPIRNLYSPENYTPAEELELFRVQPTLDLTPRQEPLVVPQGISKKLYLLPTPDLLAGEEADPENPLRPTPLCDLPDLNTWITRFAVSVIEILGGRRSASQLARWTHRHAFAEMTSQIGIFGQLPKIRRIYIAQPIEGVAETTVTIRINERVRSLILRFEGVDERWLCTELHLL